MGEAAAFYFFAALSLISALCVVNAKNPVYAVLSLVVTMFCLAALFVLLKAFFVAAVHLLVYAGAVLVLFLFVVMLLGVGAEGSATPAAGPVFRVFGTVTVAALLAELGLVLWLAADHFRSAPEATEGTLEAVGRLLFRQYLLPFEVTSVLLLVGIIGAVVLARREPA
ncbi:MAG: NADH-quinone oxidoreductase subunit J [Candidatus Omnitrophica bacterium]|nr:NADH-quinone oxidoreductase subunit J [Candidatus Omnitrophota bacterium]